MSTPLERADRDLEEYVRAAFDDLKAGLWTAMPGIVKSVDMAKQRCSVQISIKSIQKDEKGNFKQVALPLLQDVPLQFPGGGGAALTFPVKPGDETLVVFSSRSPDSWQQNGGENNAPIDAATHSLSGGFALMGFRSDPKAQALTGGAHADEVQLRSEDGQSSISLRPGGAITIKNQDVTLALSSGGLDITGGYVKHNGRNIGHDHVHGEVRRGGANTGVPTN